MSAFATILVGARKVRLRVFGPNIAGAVPAAAAQPDATKSLREDGTWSSSGGSGITQLTGDVTAGPGSGSQAATVVKARGLRETSGPTTLTMGAVADGQTLKRVGSTVVGAWIALAYATAPMAEIDAPGAQMGGYTTGGGTVA